VRDHGRGIPADLLPRLFELFVQGEQTLARSEGGLGVGLTLARTLVELHGGTIEAHSAGPDTGATFVVRWPRSPAGLPARHPTTAPAASGARRILIVDDNADAADMLGTLLQSLGHDVAIAFDGPSALELARRFVPDVGLLDIGLPGMDGYELARRLRLEDACRHTLLVAITGYSQPSDRLRSKAAGFAYHFVKPVELSSLMMFLATRGGDRAS
jgi:CheY-like chemotaxis protein